MELKKEIDDSWLGILDAEIGEKWGGNGAEMGCYYSGLNMLVILKVLMMETRLVEASMAGEVVVCSMVALKRLRYGTKRFGTNRFGTK